ncbi:AAA family ATPase [Streptomyces lavenduligriseus]|uniref:AAA family ATPase n=1 Tax=Streptomyces lavenduligriseus TaxID=67315 RepID=UPI002019C763|nr:ATP-binding protein [Streptomyces lavenduligriseus]
MVAGTDAGIPDPVIDAVNAVETARQQWRVLAGRHRVPVAVIEVVCSDAQVHRRRLEHRSRSSTGSAATGCP